MKKFTRYVRNPLPCSLQKQKRIVVREIFRSRSISDFFNSVCQQRTRGLRRYGTCIEKPPVFPARIPHFSFMVYELKPLKARSTMKAESPLWSRFFFFSWSVQAMTRK